MSYGKFFAVWHRRGLLKKLKLAIQLIVTAAMSAKMHFCIDGSGDITFVFGDFIMAAVLFVKSINIYVSCSAQTSGTKLTPWGLPATWFTSYSTLPRLGDRGEIYIYKCVVDRCHLANSRNGNIFSIIFTLRQTYCREWQPVTEHVQDTIYGYLQQLIAY